MDLTVQVEPATDAATDEPVRRPSRRRRRVLIASGVALALVGAALGRDTSPRRTRKP